jgi:hypothetical protein
MQIHLGSKHLVADVAVALDVTGREHLVIVAKASWRIPEPGQRPRPIQPQPLVMADEFYGEPGESAMRYGSDFARFKPKCDVLFDACAHAPEGKAVKQMDVEVQVGAMKKRVRVHGPRKWQRILGLTQMGEAEPFTRMPLHYGYAFGGTRWYDKGLGKNKQRLAEAHLANPSGLGYAGSKTADQMHDEPAPSLEKPGKAVGSPGAKLEPWALSAVARHWSPRRELAGTYDEAWQRDVFPLLPADFNEAYHQCSPLDQQIPHLQGGEEVTLLGLLPGRAELRFTLPQLKLYAHVRRSQGATESRVLAPDTLFFETEAHRFSAVMRATYPLHRHMQEFESITVNSLDPERWRERQAQSNCVGCGAPSSRLAEGAH